MKLGAQLRNPTTDPGGDGLTVSHSATEGFFVVAVVEGKGGERKGGDGARGVE